ncbi:hypothetical protein D9611_007531 [Ephemerocybe angulata]|uniref:Uncharacterized protein n=1 Tax=Ephemerocybe angulata TaxID=980116 RepID=A0A8H5CHC4_9AGAR|nr:hypothetical protein D9611_007531 [Tulosesus angulatus]
MHIDTTRPDDALPVTRDSGAASLYGGGAHVQRKFTWAELGPFLVQNDLDGPAYVSGTYELVRYAPQLLLPHLNLTELKSVAKVHGLKPQRGQSRESIVSVLREHVCGGCEPHTSIFTCSSSRAGQPIPRPEYINDAIRSIKSFTLDEILKFANIPSDVQPTDDILGDSFVCHDVPWMTLAKKGTNGTVVCLASLHGVEFPVRTSKAGGILELGKHVLSIVRDFCEDLRPEHFEESGCASCGQLTLLTELTPLESLACSLDPLVEPGLARRERHSSKDPIEYESGPILDKSLTAICPVCVDALNNGRRPHNALANGLWVGPVPSILADLTYAEQVLVARIRTNRCVVRVSSAPGRPAHSKMIANAISFACPTMKIYHQLPPPRSEVDEVLAFIFTGVNPPEEDEIVRSPMLVRRNNVKNALEWLKLNHADYADLLIDYETLGTYPERGSVVKVVVRALEDGTNVVASTTSVHDTFEDDGTTSGPCPFTVNGLIGSRLDSMSLDARRAAATRHLRTGDSTVLAVGHSDTPESKYNNPQLYPQIYPWCFPTARGLGTARLHGRMSETTQKKWMLMYHDKRFQTETRFIIVAFNDEQIKESKNGSIVLTRRSNFASIASRVHKINPVVIKDIATRLQEGERVIPETEEEKLCFSIMDQIDHVGSSVHGSLAGKKNMRSEVWSLIANRGAPSWFITLSPADNKHPYVYIGRIKK